MNEKLIALSTDAKNQERIGDFIPEIHQIVDQLGMIEFCDTYSSVENVTNHGRLSNISSILRGMFPRYMAWLFFCAVTGAINLNGVKLLVPASLPLVPFLPQRSNRVVIAFIIAFIFVFIIDLMIAKLITDYFCRIDAKRREKYIDESISEFKDKVINLTYFKAFKKIFRIIEEENLTLDWIVYVLFFIVAALYFWIEQGASLNHLNNIDKNIKNISLLGILLNLMTGSFNGFVILLPRRRNKIAIKYAQHRDKLRSDYNPHAEIPFMNKLTSQILEDNQITKEQIRQLINREEPAQKYENLDYEFHKNKEKILDSEKKEINLIEERILNSNSDADSIRLEGQKISIQIKSLEDRISTIRKYKSDLNQIMMEARNIGVNVNVINEKLVDISQEEDMYNRDISRLKKDYDNKICQKVSKQFFDTYNQAISKCDNLKSSYDNNINSLNNNENQEIQFSQRTDSDPAIIRNKYELLRNEMNINFRSENNNYIQGILSQLTNLISDMDNQSCDLPANISECLNTLNSRIIK